MKIHSSSLSSSSIRTNRQYAEKVHSNNVETSKAGFLSDGLASSSKNPTVDAKPEALQIFSDDINLNPVWKSPQSSNNANNPTLSRALSAYHKELNKPLFESDNNVSLKIDAFV